jgi:hypothetical protein
METIDTRLTNYIFDPKNPIYNFQLAQEYESIHHTASAAGFYLRVAEFSHSKLLIYESLLRMALCFRAQGNRTFTVTGLLMRAVTVLPDRPEAYFLLARTYEQAKEWQEAYTWTILGEKVAESVYSEPLRTDVQYPGSWGFLFERQSLLGGLGYMTSQCIYFVTCEIIQMLIWIIRYLCIRILSS